MKKSVLAGFIGLALIGCGGGGGESKPTPPPINESKPVAVQGTVNLVDYVNHTLKVNGYTYKIDRVEYGTQALPINSLKQNMMVEVNAIAEKGVVVSIEPTMVGTIDDISFDRKTFVVNGITLSFAIDPQIERGNWVMVSSLPQATADGLSYKVLSVVKIEQEDVAGQYEIEGRLSELDQITHTFKLGSTTKVSFNNAVIEADDGLNNGQWVEVKGHMDNYEFTATEVEVETYDDSDNDNEIEGIITWINSNKTEFELNARGRFAINSQTHFEDGSLSDLRTGLLVEVTVVNGIAKEVEFNHSFDDEINNINEFERNGVVTEVNTNNGSFYIGSEEFYIDDYTEFENFLTINTLYGQNIEIEGMVIQGKKFAREIELYYD